MPKDLFDKLYGNSIVLTNLRGQRRIPFLPEEEIDALREKRLREMVRYAAETVPFYRNFFHIKNIDPRKIQSTKNLGLLPLIEKTAAQNVHPSFSQPPAGGEGQSRIEPVDPRECY